MSYETEICQKIVDVNVALAKRNIMPREKQELLKRRMRLYDELKQECYAKSNADARLKHNLEHIEQESHKRGVY